ncbi:unnamed protein product [Linum trigynum]|uniref:Uncharacterized protein n=1 Tax=Linum trigynum TaxID=586398 RepID=A0AAV2FW48_9ROSI
MITKASPTHPRQSPFLILDLLKLRVVYDVDIAANTDGSKTMPPPARPTTVFTRNPSPTASSPPLQQPRRRRAHRRRSIRLHDMEIRHVTVTLDDDLFPDPDESSE